MSRTRKLLLAGSAALALAGVGVGIAQAVGDSEESVSGPDADRARQAALRSVGGGRAVEVEREDDGRAGWEVEVERPDGRQVEVHLDAELRQVGVEADDDGAEDRDDD